MAKTKATLDMIRSAATKADNVHDGIRDEFSRLYNEIVSVGGAAFQGGAGSQFQNTSAQMAEKMNTILANLRHIAEATVQSEKAYGASDAQSSQDFAALNNESDGTVIAALTSK
jgi:WXG100 family type VII secretion target